MKKKKLQSLKNELFNSEEILSNDLRELVEVVGGGSPGTTKSKDCSDAQSDCKKAGGSVCKPTKWRSDSSEEGDTVRAEDRCNDEATQVVINTINNYVEKSSDGVISGALMEEE